MDIICASICYRGFAEDEVAATLENAPPIGYHWMEVHGPLTWSLEAIDCFDLPTLQARISASRMACAGMYTPGWGGKDDADALAHARAIARCAEFTAELGGDHVTSTGAVQASQDARSHQRALDLVILCAKEALRLLPADSPVHLALEPHYGNILQRPEDFAAVLDAIRDKRLGVCVDTGHFHSARVDIPAFIHRFASRLYNVHMKDHIGTRSVGIGRGEIDLAAVITALREANYQGGLTVELEVDDPQNLPRYTEEAYFYLNGLLGQKLADR